MTTTMKTDETLRDDVRNYYGEVLQSSDDLQTDACCSAESIPRAYRPIVSKIHDDILDKFYGCGSPLPYSLEGCTVVDLGCGSGRDAYLLSALVGPKGRVIGVDMTPEQLEVARKYVDHQTAAFGYETANIEFRHGLIEDLSSVGLEDNSVDLIVSNCVINLSPEKERVFSEIFRVLKPGGELYFSDIFAGRRIPKELVEDPLLRGECLSGSLYSHDFRRMLARNGVFDYRIVNSSRLNITNPAVEQRIGMVDFYSETVRAFKLDLEDRCENYGQVAYYNGTIPESPHSFRLDDHHIFQTGLPYPVCGNTAEMLQKSRYAKHFRVIGDTSTHYGLFDCAPASAQEATEGTGGCC